MYVKICGITRREDAEQAALAGASAVGFNFWPSSPRYVAPRQAARLGDGLAVERVGVFVDSSPEEVREIAEIARLDIVQLHGAERPDFPTDGLRAWKAFRIHAEWNAAEAAVYRHCEAFLLDGPMPGSGIPFSWSKLSWSKLKPTWCELQLAAGFSPPPRIVLAGGLSPANIAQAIEIVQPWGVDACSKLETAPGIKDHQAMTAFISAARSREVACT